MPTMIYKTNTATVEPGLDCIMSDMTPDSYGDIIGDSVDPMLGWDLSDFVRNPIALWSHSSQAPIGTWKDVHVANAALRGRLHLAPPGSTKLVDELRALLGAGVLKGISVGFIPIEAKQRANGGMHYLRQTLCEASLVSIPANPSALLTAKALGISESTQRLVFRRSDPTLGQEVRHLRRTIQELKALRDKSKSPKDWSRDIAILEEALRELIANLQTVHKPVPKKFSADHKTAVLAKARALLKRADEEEAAREAASFVGQHRQQQNEMMNNFEAQARKHADPPKQTFKRQETTWRGQVIPGLSWRGRKI